MPRSVVLALLLLAACGGAPGPAAEQDARRRAEDAAAALMERLFLELQTALAAGPPEHALSVCAERAQELTQEIAREQGVALRRTALRTRNPRNAPDAYERAWMEGAGTAAPGGEARVVATDGGYELRYLRPVRLAELCTTCHGTPERIPPAVAAEIAKRYPQDRAVGFVPGDLRGAVSVRVPFE